MPKAPLPANERARLASVRALQILDTPREERFDRLTRMAQRMFGVSASLVTVVDHDRQWFKSVTGIDGVNATPRDVSFCAHAILQDETMVVRDTLKDPRFADNPLVTTEPKIRFYAGSPIHTRDGSKVGTFCIVNLQPKEFGSEDIRLLDNLAKMTEQELHVHQPDTMDHLTRLLNRRGFLALGQQALDLATRDIKPSCLAFVRMDGLEQINAGFGPVEGAKALQGFADQLRRSFRSADLLARIDNDRFVALLFDCDGVHAQTILERMLMALDLRNQFSKSGYLVTCSFAVLEVPEQPRLGMQSLLSRGDGIRYDNGGTVKPS